MMSKDTKAPLKGRDEKEPFLIPPGQPGSYVDALTAARCMVTTTRININNDIVVLVILEVPQWTFR